MSHTNTTIRHSKFDSLQSMSAERPQPSPHPRKFNEPTNSRSISESSSETVVFESLHDTELIDNSTRQYNLVRLACGATVHVGENVLVSCSGVLDTLNNDILGCISVLPASTHKLVRRTKIWINDRYEIFLLQIFIMLQSLPTPTHHFDFVRQKLRVWSADESNKSISCYYTSLFWLAFMVR
jgi:hypothetical protein